MKIWYDYYNNIGVVIVIAITYFTCKYTRSKFPSKNRKIGSYILRGVSIDAPAAMIVDIIVGRYFAIGSLADHWRITDT